MKKILIGFMILSALFVLPACAAKTGVGKASPSGASAASSGSLPSGKPAAGASASAQPSPSGTAPAASPTAGAPQASAAPSPAATAAAAAVPDQKLVRLDGTIGTTSAYMSLAVKNGVVSGSYYYTNPEHDLKLSGTIEGNGLLTMKETDAAGVVTGKFDGQYVPGIRLTGVWTNTKTGAKLDFSLTVLGGTAEGAVWSGEWKRLDTGRFNSASLVIFNETKTGFEFQTEAFNGANMGFLNGKATISGATASYKDSATGAALSFSLSGGIVTVNANDAANGQAGAGVVFGGKFTKAALPEDTLLSLGYVTTKAQDDAFRAMTGKDYKLFLNTANIRVDAKDLDGLGATVYAWWVHGFAGTNESMVMFLPGGKLIAAVIDPEKNVVRVYTNDPAVTSVPKTVKAWSEKFSNMSVEFKRAS